MKRFFVLAIALLLALVFALLHDEHHTLQAAPERNLEQLRGPSMAIYPPQSIPLNFNHKKHIGDLHVPCVNCHQNARSSRASADRLLAPGTTCDTCHGTNHTDPLNVLGTAERLGQCTLCHQGTGTTIARVQLPAPNLNFSHQAHAVRNIACGQCHANIETLEKATREDLPRMPTCLNCHREGEAGGDAKASCDTCHFTGADGKRGARPGGRIRTEFATGTLLPPRWLRNAAHDSGFLARHKMVAGDDSQFCANCHKEEFCTDCHDGRIRPRNIHPNDYLSMHAVESKQATQKCNSCHREQSFCLSCHQRLGVAMSGPASVRENGRFHPPKSVFSDLPRRPGHHAQEAARNLNACVSCHIERDCVACHGARGVGGGLSPHPANFRAECGRLFARNPRPCLVCHETERELAQCQ
jgi:hypothetical protein